MFFFGAFGTPLLVWQRSVALVQFFVVSGVRFVWGGVITTFFHDLTE